MRRTNQQNIDPLITADELAAILGISSRSLHRRRALGIIIHPINSIGHPRWRRKEIEDWIDAGCPPASEWQWSPNQKGVRDE